MLSNTDKPVYISFTLQDETDQSPCLRSGEPVSDAVSELLDKNVAGIFFNCSIPEVIEHAIQEVNQVTKQTAKGLIIGVYANSFAPIKSDHQANESLQEMRYFSPSEYLEYAQKMVSTGREYHWGLLWYRAKPHRSISKLER